MGQEGGFLITARVVVAVQARMNSYRLPGKALREVRGKPALWHPIFNATRSGLPVVLVTPSEPDNDPIAEYGKDLGIRVHRSPRGITTELLHAAQQEEVTRLVRVTGDDLFPDPGYMRRALKLLDKKNLDFVDMPQVARGRDSSVISRRVLEWLAEGDNPEVEYLDIVLRGPRVRYDPLVLDKWEADKELEIPNLELNTEEDLLRIEAYLSAQTESVK